MGLDAGILFAAIALLCWGFGDFLIQRSVRKLGGWETLLVITGFGTLVLTPFVWSELPQIYTLPAGFWVLLAGSVVIFFAALLDLEALRQGKLMVVEPVLAFEVPFSVLLAYLVLGETLTLAQGALIGLILLGLLLLSLRSPRISRKLIEKGAVLGLGAAVFMGSALFLVGFGSRLTSPLLVNWFLNLFNTIVCIGYLALMGRLGRFVEHMRRNKRLLLGLSLFDNGAWVAYAFAALLAPIGLVVAISESYIALSVLLGFVVNKERIHQHQKVGLVLALAGVIVLAAM